MVLATTIRDRLERPHSVYFVLFIMNLMLKSDMDSSKVAYVVEPVSRQNESCSNRPKKS